VLNDCRWELGSVLLMMTLVTQELRTTSLKICASNWTMCHFLCLLSVCLSICAFSLSVWVTDQCKMLLPCSEVDVPALLNRCCMLHIKPVLVAKNSNYVFCQQRLGSQKVAFFWETTANFQQKKLLLLRIWILSLNVSEWVCSPKFFIFGWKYCDSE